MPSVARAGRRRALLRGRERMMVCHLSIGGKPVARLLLTEVLWRARFTSLWMAIGVTYCAYCEAYEL
jgi:hypothetical protein